MKKELITVACLSQLDDSIDYEWWIYKHFHIDPSLFTIIHIRVMAQKLYPLTFSIHIDPEFGFHINRFFLLS